MRCGKDGIVGFLEDVYSEGRFGMVPVFGRRGLGKTSALKEFMAGKPGVFFTPCFDYRLSLRKLSELVFGYPSDIPLRRILDELRSRSLDSGYVLIIDEYTRLLSESEDFSCELQDFIDDSEDSCRLFIVLCGSSSDLMRKHVMRYSCPLYGRYRRVLALEELGPAESLRMLDGFCIRDALRIFSMVGGVPSYLAKFDSRLSIEENVVRNFLEPSSFFSDEAHRVLSEDWDKPRGMEEYTSLIADGSRLSEVAESWGKGRPRTAVMLQYLCDAGAVSKLTPIDNPEGRSTRYAVSDRFLGFWFRTAEPRTDFYDREDIRRAAAEIVAECDSRMASVYTQLCAEYLKREHPGRLGTWWGRDPATRQERSIDIVTMSEWDGVRTGWFADCYFGRGTPGPSDLESLAEASALVGRCDVRNLVVFSDSGFSPDLLGTDAELVSLDTVLRHFLEDR